MNVISNSVKFNKVKLKPELKSVGEGKIKPLLFINYFEN